MRVGVTANSHKVIRNLLDAVCLAADESEVELTCIQKVPEETPDEGRLRFTTDNGICLSALYGDCRVAGGTAWFWARPDAFDSVDFLFVDEAAQMSLANVLAVSQAAKSLVLLGDPQQLDQPTQGSHPDGTDTSALDHILAGHQTIPEDRGLFLEETWRLHPSICALTSELFYEGRLRPSPAWSCRRSDQRVNSRARGSAIVKSSIREIRAPRWRRPTPFKFVRKSPTWIDREGIESPMTLDEILIIAPYNAQVFELQTRLPGARVGTVDKFQGQEVPLVIYSMTTSKSR